MDIWLASRVRFVKRVTSASNQIKRVEMTYMIAIISGGISADDIIVGAPVAGRGVPVSGRQRGLVDVVVLGRVRRVGLFVLIGGGAFPGAAASLRPSVVGRRAAPSRDVCGSWRQRWRHLLSPPRAPPQLAREAVARRSLSRRWRRRFPVGDGHARLFGATLDWPLFPAFQSRPLVTVARLHQWRHSVDW